MICLLDYEPSFSWEGGDCPWNPRKKRTQGLQVWAAPPRSKEAQANPVKVCLIRSGVFSLSEGEIGQKKQRGWIGVLGGIKTLFFSSPFYGGWEDVSHTIKRGFTVANMKLALVKGNFLSAIRDDDFQPPEGEPAPSVLGLTLYMGAGVNFSAVATRATDCGVGHVRPLD